MTCTESICTVILGLVNYSHKVYHIVHSASFVKSVGSLHNEFTSLLMYSCGHFIREYISTLPVNCEVLYSTVCEMCSDHPAMHSYASTASSSFLHCYVTACYTPLHSILSPLQSVVSPLHIVVSVLHSMMSRLQFVLILGQCFHLD